MENLLKSLGVEYCIDFIGYDCPKNWGEEKHQHKHYRATLSRGSLVYSLDYWDSLNDSFLIRVDMRKYPFSKYKVYGYDKTATPYKYSHKFPYKIGPVQISKGGHGVYDADLVENPIIPEISEILECCQISEPPLSFSGFCSEFGYLTDSIKAVELHRAVLEEYSGLRNVFGSEGLEKVFTKIYEQ